MSYQTQVTQVLSGRTGCYMDSTILMERDVSSSAADLLLKGCLHCIEQCEEVVNSLGADDYANSYEGSSSMGSHVRHILDRFQSLFVGLPGLSVDYDARKRDKAIESSTGSARFAIALVSWRMRELDLVKLLGQSISVRETVYHRAAPIKISSTLERELMGLITHSIHHLAIISMLAKQCGHSMGPSFGKAPSTLVYERS
ncbi:MAG: putative damage-inducible protein DinB [Pseudohongiellaceae bacterium]|jgi:uncharacterized damage-inducible protein DinB